MELFQTQFALFILLAPLGIIGLWRWSVYLFKVRSARHYRSIPATDEFKNHDVTFVVPVYNEAPEQFMQALASWEAEAPGQIILVIDHSDERCITIAQRFRDRSHVPTKIVVTARPGKREALVDGIALVRTPFVTLIDSDTLFTPGVIQLLLAPFTDPRIGGVAPRQRVYRPKTIAQRVYQVQLEERYEVEMPFLDVGGLTTTCISGRTGMYRTAAVREHLPELEEEYFWGTRCISGDDKCLTRIVQRNDWLVKYQDTALVFTHAAPNLLTYLKQRIRWTRNTWRSDLLALTNEGGWIYRNRYLTFHTIDRFIQPFTLILGPIFFLTALATGFYYAAALFALWILATRLLKLSTHVARFPSVFLILPHYIIITYIIAVLKIFALFTVWKQGWITRWSRSRLSVPATAVRRTLGHGLPVVATVVVVLFLASGVDVYYQRAIALALQNDAYYSFNDVTEAEAILAAADLEEEIRRPTETRTHVIDSGETLQLIAERYNVLPAQLSFEGAFAVGTEVSIPIAALREPNSVADLETRPRPEISFTPFSQTGSGWEHAMLEYENIVHLDGPGTAISLGELLQHLADAYGPEVVEELAPGEWLLKSSIAVNRDVTLYMSGETVDWLKLISTDEYYIWVSSFDGSLHIEDTTITSWDPDLGTYDVEYETFGRSFILAKQSGRMDVINSEIAYLGYTEFDETRGHPFGGSYGLSWKIDHGTLQEAIITGNVINSDIHNNMFGIYTFGSTGHLMTGNIVRDNVRYGFDPHDDSMYIIIENNDVFSNGSHGIITSKRCMYNLIAHNRSYGNALHGVMMDQTSDHTVIKGNEFYNNVDGVVILDSSGNFIVDNVISDNLKAGIRMNKMSEGNVSVRNRIEHNDKGIFLYDGTIHNLFWGNQITGGSFGVHIKDAMLNTLIETAVQGSAVRVKANERGLKNYVSLTH